MCGISKRPCSAGLSGRRVGSAVLPPASADCFSWASAATSGSHLVHEGIHMVDNYALGCVYAAVVQIRVPAYALVAGAIREVEWGTKNEEEIREFSTDGDNIAVQG